MSLDAPPCMLISTLRLIGLSPHQPLPVVDFVVIVVVAVVGIKGIRQGPALVLVLIEGVVG